ncbi:MAG: 50S ribosomal protein L9 [Gemmatimonadetes bacterium]|uniref:Ribosomal protein L9 domain-containing protein n=1 Tax=marine metagenome TaxID=408172 RepID=A0A381UUM0_9ZZZZ|nr:50S ribosomal protein L9 [Gemmatimonadota bacterium]|tara:strand:+ start:245 stop:700 length:456 start_codon:yes stop_codon:yes gene_type:complete
MKLILKENVKGLGESGDIVDVKAGYARNYLIPQGLSYPANPANLQKLQEEQDQLNEEMRGTYLEAGRRAAQMEDLSVTFNVLAAEDGKLFGSVSNLDLVDRLNDGNLDFVVDRSMVQLDEPLKMIGDFTVAVRLHEESVVEIGVRIVREDS